MYFKNIAITSVILATFCFSAFALASPDNLGEKITKVSEGSEVKYLTQDELTTHLNGNTIIGESIKSKKSNNYFKENYNTDGTVTAMILAKSDHSLRKNIKGKWSVKKDGTFCSEWGSKVFCNKKVTKIGKQYMSVLKKGDKIFAIWSIKK